MAKQTINIGTALNAKDGDTVRDAFNKVNQNFDELYTATGIDGYDPSRLINGAQIVSLDTNGILTLPSSSYLESTDVNLKIGAQGTVTVRSNAASNLTTKEWTFGADGTLNLPTIGNAVSIIQTTKSIQLISNTKTWSFALDGNLTLPPGGDILNSTGSSVLGTPTFLDGGDASTVF